MVNDKQLLCAGVTSLEQRCPYCSKSLNAYPLIMSDDPKQAIYHASCAVQLTTDLLVDLYTFFSPPVPYDCLFTLTTSAPILHSEGGGNASNRS